MFDSLPEILLQSDWIYWIYWPERSVTKKEKEIRFQMKNKTNNNNFVFNDAIFNVEIPVL